MRGDGVALWIDVTPRFEAELRRKEQEEVRKAREEKDRKAREETRKTQEVSPGTQSLDKINT